MRTYPLLLVAAVTLSAYVDASSTRSSSTFERPAPSHQHAPRRFLRDGANTTEEERAPNFIKATFGSSAGKSDEALVAALSPKDFTADVITNLLNAIKFEDKNVLKSNQFKTYLWLMEQKRAIEGHSEAQMYVDIAKDLDRRYKNDFPGLLRMLQKSYCLKLKERGVEDPNFMLWVKYVTIQCEFLKNPGGEWKEMVNVLEQSYEYNELLTMLSKAFKNKKTKEIATKLMVFT
ncbi:unnamed protein product [Peronospora farinosa]|uniref:RxLR effector protein n=1 Tax=Peronospora farinosa TaxID=134698 RepID=A0AAV0TQ69_9STRA|nr:unnamed protein product [Peronospora farinosa]